MSKDIPFESDATIAFSDRGRLRSIQVANSNSIRVMLAILSGSEGKVREALEAFATSAMVAGIELLREEKK